MIKFINYLKKLQSEKKITKTQINFFAFATLLFLTIVLVLPFQLRNQKNDLRSRAQMAEMIPPTPEYLLPPPPYFITPTTLIHQSPTPLPGTPIPSESPTTAPLPISTGIPTPLPTITPTSYPTPTSSPIPTYTPSPTFTPTPTPVITVNGLKGEYFDNKDLTNLKFTRIDSSINFNWGYGQPSSSIGSNTFSVRWTGKVMPKYNQTYTFYTYTNDGVRLWVDGKLLIDKWYNQDTREWSGSISLSAGQKYSIKMEYFENSGNAVVQLRWRSSSQSKQIIPQSQLYSN